MIMILKQVQNSKAHVLLEHGLYSLLSPDASPLFT